MKPAVKAVQEWLKTCPYVASQLGGNVAFHIDYLPEDTTQFSIEDSPGDPVLQEFFSGRRKAKNYVLASRMEYSESIAQQADMARRVLRTKQAGRVWRSAPVFASGQRPAQRKPAKRKRYEQRPLPVAETGSCEWRRAPLFTRAFMPAGKSG